MDVFEEFDPAPDAAAPQDAAPAGPERSRGRTVALALATAAVAVLALVGGVWAAAKVLVPDPAPGCDATGLAAQRQLVSFLQQTMDNTVDLGREVTAVGCEPGGAGPGAQVQIIDDAELEQLRGVLSGVGCPIGGGVPATCRATVQGVDLQVDVTDAADAADDAADYDLTVTLVAPTTGT